MFFIYLKLNLFKMIATSKILKFIQNLYLFYILKKLKMRLFML